MEFVGYLIKVLHAIIMEYLVEDNLSELDFFGCKQYPLDRLGQNGGAYKVPQ